MAFLTSDPIQVWNNEDVWQHFASNMPAEGDSLIWDGPLFPQPEISAPEVESNPDPMIEGIEKVKRYACKVPGCGKDYAKSTGLRAHFKVKHEVVQKKFACPFSGCQSNFAENHELTRHLKKTHKVAMGPKKSLVFICPVEGCQSRYKQDRGLKKHIQKVHSD